jgi:hypothetical protein
MLVNFHCTDFFLPWYRSLLLLSFRQKEPYTLVNNAITNGRIKRWNNPLAIVVNLIFAAFAGVVLPSLLIRFKIDPALAGGVILFLNMHINICRAYLMFSRYIAMA